MNWTEARAVLTLFLIPIGGGIPAGVLLAKSYEMPWAVTGLLYFVSDVALAIVFEPLMILFMWMAARSELTRRWAETYKQLLARTGFNHGLAPSPFALIVLSFGVDPMTGRAAARAVGHGFVAGWAIAICGDMIYFALIMASTLWLNSWLGDGTLTTVLIMLAMFAAPPLLRKLRRAKG